MWGMKIMERSISRYFSYSWQKLDRGLQKRQIEYTAAVQGCGHNGHIFYHFISSSLHV